MYHVPKEDKINNKNIINHKKYRVATIYFRTNCSTHPKKYAFFVSQKSDTPT